MISAIVFLSLSAAPVKLAAPGFQSVNLRIELALFFSNDFTNRMREQGLQVISAQDIQTVLGIERQKQLIGCEDDGSNCLAELADAFGVDGVITGSVGKFDNSYRVIINVISATSAKPLASFTQTVVGQKKVFGALSDAAAALAPEVYKSLHRTPVMVGEAPRPARTNSWAFVAAGGVLAFSGLGGGLVTASVTYHSVLKCDPNQPCALTQAQAQSAHDSGQLLQTLGIASFVVAAACAGLAIWLFVRSDDASPPPALALGLAPGWFGVTGRF